MNDDPTLIEHIKSYFLHIFGLYFHFRSWLRSPSINGKIDEALKILNSFNAQCQNALEKSMYDRRNEQNLVGVASQWTRL